MNPENADLLTNATIALDRYRAEERALELELTVMQTRLELIREVVGALAGKPRARRGRPPAPKLVEEMPLRVTGGLSSQLGVSSQLGLSSQLSQRHDGNISQPEPESAA